MVSGLDSNVHKERLQELNLPTLLERRHQADMCLVHKIMHGRGQLDFSTWFEKAGDGVRVTRTTTDPYNLRVKHGRLDLRKHFFSIRVLEAWNRIPAEIKSVDKSENFKKLYTKLRAVPMQPAA